MTVKLPPVVPMKQVCVGGAQDCLYRLATLRCRYQGECRHQQKVYDRDSTKEAEA